jgi:hypothetical protein
MQVANAAVTADRGERTRFAKHIGNQRQTDKDNE